MQENRSLGFTTRSDTNRRVQSQKIATSLKFRMKEEEGLYYQCSEISFARSAKLICAFVFTYADCWFSHAAAHFMY